MLCSLLQSMCMNRPWGHRKGTGEPALGMEGGGGPKESSWLCLGYPPGFAWVPMLGLPWLLKLVSRGTVPASCTQRQRAAEGPISLLTFSKVLVVDLAGVGELVL